MWAVAAQCPLHSHPQPCSSISSYTDMGQKFLVMIYAQWSFYIPFTFLRLFLFEMRKRKGSNMWLGYHFCYRSFHLFLFLYLFPTWEKLNSYGAKFNVHQVPSLQRSGKVLLMPTFLWKESFVRGKGEIKF